ncbi:MAG: 23S rRNA (uracil(1939)-C(5))-methyltransferase RlmD [Chlamydiota bacterium]
MQKPKKGDHALVEVKSLNKKGNGLGIFSSSEDKALNVEVPFGIPGDKINARIHKRRKGVYLSFIDEIKDPSPFRTEPRCKHFGVCGGCRMQNVPYSKQLEFKEEHVRKCFSDLLSDDVIFHKTIPCKTEWAYRNKMEFSFSSDVNGKQFLGLFMDSSKGKVMNITECHLVSPWFSDVIAETRSWWEESELKAYHPPSDRGALRTLVVREGKRTGDRMVMLTVSGNPDFALSKGELENFVNAIRKASESTDSSNKLSIFLRIQQVAKGMPTNFYEMLLYGPDHIREVLEVQIDPEDQPQKLHFHISPTAFFQPNTEQAERLYSTALQMACVEKGSVVYDLYCGTGTLGICAASRAKEVIGIEVSPESALDAKTNASLNDINNIKIISGAVRHVLGDCGIDGVLPKPDLVVIDPPRPGLDPEAMQGLLKLCSPRILYISCNPETQAENVREIVQHGYRLEAVQPIDQFAHTPHIENIVVLVKEPVDGES